MNKTCTLEDLISKYVHKADGDYKSFDPTRPDGLSTHVDIAKGDSVIVHPSWGQGDGKCWKATTENLQHFLANGCEFTRHWSAEIRKELAEIGSTLATPFGRALDMNLLAGKAPKIPNFNLPLWMKWLPVSLCFSSREDVTKKLIPKLDATGSNAYLESLQKCGVITKRADLSVEDFAAVGQSNLLRVFELRRGSVLVRVFAFFVTPIGADGDVKAADATVEKALLSFEESINAASPQKPNARFVVMGTPLGWTLKEGTAQRGSDFFEMRVTPPSQLDQPWKAWHIDSPPFLGAGTVYRNFVFLTFPESADQREKRIRTFLDREFDSYGGDSKRFNVGEVAAKTGDPEELLAQAFDALVSAGHFGIDRDKSGRQEIRKNKEKLLSGAKFWKAGRFGREKKSLLKSILANISDKVFGSIPLLVALLTYTLGKIGVINKPAIQMTNIKITFSAILICAVFSMIKKTIAGSADDA